MQPTDPANCQITACIAAVKPIYSSCDFDVLARECKSQPATRVQLAIDYIQVVTVHYLPSVCNAVGEFTPERVECVYDSSITARATDIGSMCPDLDVTTLTDGTDVRIVMVFTISENTYVATAKQ